MPKRTKEQKILAQKHRMLQAMPGTDIASPSLSVKDFLPKARQSSAANEQTQAAGGKDLKTAGPVSDVQAVRHDVTRIAIITIALLATEGILYYLLEIRKIIF